MHAGSIEGDLSESSRTVSGPPESASSAILTLPNMLSFARLATVPVFIWLFVSGHENAAVALYAVGAWTDFFDGYLARKLGSVSELGKLLDPLADRVFIVALCVALVARDTLSIWYAVAIVGRDVLLLSVFPLLERRKVPRIAVNFVGKTATAALLFGLTCLAISETTFIGSGVGDELGIAFTAGGTLLYYVAAAMYARQAMALLRSSDSGVSR